MKFMIMGFLLEKYGPLLTYDELSDLLKLEVSTLQNKLCSGDIDLPKTHQGRRVMFHVEDVCEYIHNLRGNG